MVYGNDYYVYYIDCTGLSDYLDMLQEFYDRDTLQRTEVISMLHSQYLAAIKAHERDLIKRAPCFTSWRNAIVMT